MKMIKTQIAEQATGIAESPSKSKFGLIYTGSENIKGFVSGGGVELTEAEARERLMDYRPIVLPSMGAGSYRKVFCELGGFREVRVMDWTSSAGDWSFGVYDGDCWHMAFQSNRYPHRGFEYSIDFGMAESFKELAALT